MAKTENGRTVETATEARAGATGTGARYVLAFSTVGAVALMAVVYLFFFT